MAVNPQLLTGLGAVLAIFLSAAGSAIASSHGGIYAMRNKSYKAFVPVIQAGVLSLYGITISVLLVRKLKDDMTEVEGYRNISAGLALGLACCASGFGMANFIHQVNNEPITKLTQSTISTTSTSSTATEPLIGERSICPVSSTPHNFVHFCLCMIFLEAIGLYGLIVALFLMG